MTQEKKALRLSSLLPAFLAIVVDSLGFGLVYPLMADLFTQGGMGAAYSEGVRHFLIGIGFMLYPFSMFFGASFMGDLSDILGRKRVLLICMSGLALSFLFMGIGVYVHSITLLFIGRGFSGLMAGSQPIAQASVVDLSLPEEKARNLSLMTFVLSVGIVIGPLIGGFFSDRHIFAHFTFSTPFYVAAGLALIALVWIFFKLPETYLVQRENKTLHWFRPIQIIIDGFRHKQIRFLALIFAFMQMGFSLFYQLIQLFLATTFHYEAWQIGLFNGWIGLAFAVVVLFGMKWLLKIFKIKKIAILALCLTGISILIQMLFPLQIVVWTSTFFTAGFDMVAYAALLTCFSDAVDSQRQGWALGLFGSIVAASFAATSFSTNLIPFLGLRWLIAIGGGLFLISTLFMLRYHKIGSSHSDQ